MADLYYCLTEAEKLYLKYSNNKERIPPIPDFTKPGFYKTRDGRKAEVLKYEPLREKYPLVGMLDLGIMAWHLDGRSGYASVEGLLDLIAPWTEPASGEFWYVIAGDRDYEALRFLRNTLDDAHNLVRELRNSGHRIIVPPTRVEWKEPEPE